MTTHGETPDYWRRRGKFWDEQSDTIARAAETLNQPLIDAADIQPGQQVLDLASGPGEPALTIARLVGPDGAVVATDLVEEMLAGTRRRAQSLGLANLTAETADMQDLPVDDGSFDRVTCRFGIMFVPDKAAAFAEVRRVLRPGGRAAFMVWGPMENNTMFGIFHRAIDAVLGADSGHDTRAQFSFAAPGSLDSAFAEAGFVQTEEREVRLSPRIERGKPFWASQLRMNVGPLVDGRPDEAALTAEIGKRVAEGFEETVVDGAYALTLHARIGVGTAPQVGG